MATRTPWVRSELWLTLLLLGSCYAASTHDDTSLKLADLQDISYDEGQTFKTGWYTQELDHFNFNSDQKFSMRFLFDDQYWKEENGNPGPVFVYTGNESPLEVYWGNNGYITDVLAKKYNALIIFMEHRYYGQSLPFGEDSFDLDNMVWNNAEQALADYAIFLQEFRETNLTELNKSAFIAWGGSYGGMLSSWLRMKYPHAVDGALASSAPIHAYLQEVDPNAFNKIVADDFRAIDERCPSAIRLGFALLEDLRDQSDTWGELSEIFDTCEPISTDEDALNLQTWLINAYQYLAMFDYPYETNYVYHLPGNPVENSCQELLASLPADFAEKRGQDKNEGGISEKDRELLLAIKASVDAYYNFDSKEDQCSQIRTVYDTYNVYYYAPDMPKSTGIEMYSWNYTACTEEVMPIASNGITDMFNARPWDQKKYDEFCQKTMGVTPRTNYIRYQYGGLQPRVDFSSHSNIIFTNGSRDPYSSGGVLTTINNSVVGVLIDQSAHHLDLFSPRDEEPESLKKVRELEAQIFEKWIAERREKVTASENLQRKLFSSKQINLITA